MIDTVQCVWLLRAAHNLTGQPSGSLVVIANQRTRVDSQVGTYYTLFYFYFFISVTMLSYFIQVICDI